MDKKMPQSRRKYLQRIYLYAEYIKNSTNSVKRKQTTQFINGKRLNRLFIPKIYKWQISM